MTLQRDVTVLLILTLTLGAGLAGCKESDDLEAGFDSEFLVRPDGYPGLKEAYNFEFADRPKHMDPGLMYKAAETGAVDVICAFKTDGRIAAYDLKILTDDKNFFPPYEAAPLVRADTLERLPQLKDVLNRLAGRLPTERMRKLNYRVDEDHEDPAVVARDFLTQEGLIGPDAQPAEGPSGSVTIGGKNFTEQEILGEIMAILIEETTDIEADRKLNLGGTMVCFEGIKSGDLDIYAEYTGTGLVSILDREAVKEPDQAFRIVSEAFKEKWNLAWLDPFGFDNAYTLTMRRQHAEELGIETISDLAEAVRKQQQEPDEQPADE